MFLTRIIKICDAVLTKELTVRLATNSLRSFLESGLEYIHNRVVRDHFGTDIGNHKETGFVGIDCEGVARPNFECFATRVDLDCAVLDEE